MKLESVMQGLQDSANAIDKIYTQGVVEGFSNTCFNCIQLQAIYGSRGQFPYQM